MGQDGGGGFGAVELGVEGVVLGLEGVFGFLKGEGFAGAVSVGDTQRVCCWKMKWNLRSLPGFLKSYPLVGDLLKSFS